MLKDQKLTHNNFYPKLQGQIWIVYEDCILQSRVQNKKSNFRCIKQNKL